MTNCTDTQLGTAEPDAVLATMAILFVRESLSILQVL